MANFPHWINKKDTSLSPRQIANKAYTLSIKKLDRDDKRRKPHYNVRERLLLSNALNKAEDLLKKQSNRRPLLSECQEDSLFNKEPVYPPPAPLDDKMLQQALCNKKKEIKSTTPSISSIATATTTTTTTTTNIAAEQLAMQLAVVAAAAAAYTSLSVVKEHCRSIMIPTASHSYTAIT